MSTFLQSADILKHLALRCFLPILATTWVAGQIGQAMRDAGLL